MSGSRLRLILLIFRLFDGFACLSVCEQDYMKMSQSVFMKPCRIMNYCYGKNSLNFGIDPTHSGGNIIFYLYFCYYVLNRDYRVENHIVQETVSSIQGHHLVNVAENK